MSDPKCDNRKKIFPTALLDKKCYPRCHKSVTANVLVGETFGNSPFIATWTAGDTTLNRLLALLTVAISVGISFAIAGHPHEDGERVRVLSTQDIQEKLDGNQAKATMVEVTIGPGESGLAHRHPGPGFVYVLEGKYELGIDDKPTKLYQAGETFYEPTGCLHRVSRNPSATEQTRLIAVVLHPHNVSEIAVPVEKHE